MPTVLPLSMLAGTLVLESSLAGWSLLDVRAGAPRVHALQVQFATVFSAPPLVHVSISGLDVSNEDNLRVRVRADSIDAGGFRVTAETWLNTKIWSVEVSWLAIGT